MGVPMKKIIIATILCGAVITFFIYKFFYHEPFIIVSFGDEIAMGETAYQVQGYSFNDYIRDFYEESKKIEEYITEFQNKEETTETFLTKLTTNYTLESTNTSIQQAIASSKITTLSLGMYELNKKNLKSKDYEKYINNIDKILKLIRIHNKKEIFFLSLYPTSKLDLKKVKNINDQLKKICAKYQVHYVDIENITEKKDYFFDDTNYQLNYKGHRYISEKIITILKEQNI